MKNCQDIQADLSAYVDGELSPSQRADIEMHVASCPRCQANVAELKKLAAGVAALPKLQPAPRFLAEVRRKIAEGLEPAESISWQDYLFRPFWLKVPLEAVAVIVIAMFALSIGKPRLKRADATFETVSAKKSADVRSYQPLVAQNETRRTEPANAPVVAPAESSSERWIQALTATAAPAPTAITLPSSPASATVSGKEQPVDSVAQNGLRADLGDNRTAGESHRPIPASGSGVSELAFASTATSGDAGLAQSLGIDRSKVRDVVTINAKDPVDVRHRAEQLVEKCKGKVIPSLQSKESTGQVFFVELPWECAAGFKSELLQNPSAIAFADKQGSGSAGNLVLMDGLRSSGSGELTGAVLTNDTDKIIYRIRLGVDVKPPSSTTTVLEIRVVPPAR